MKGMGFSQIRSKINFLQKINAEMLAAKMCNSHFECTDNEIYLVRSDGAKVLVAKRGGIKNIFGDLTLCHWDSFDDFQFDAWDSMNKIDLSEEERLTKKIPAECGQVIAVFKGMFLVKLLEEHAETIVVACLNRNIEKYILRSSKQEIQYDNDFTPDVGDIIRCYGFSKNKNGFICESWEYSNMFMKIKRKYNLESNDFTTKAILEREEEEKALEAEESAPDLFDLFESLEEIKDEK